MKVSVILPAAGRSERFGRANKLDEDLGGRPVLMRAVELFKDRDEVIEMLVAAPPDDLAQFRFKYGDRLAFHGARIVEGGRAERWESVKNALEHVSDSATHVMVHDAARPAANAELIDRVLQAGAKLEAVIPVMPVTATLKRVSEEAVETAEVDPIAAKLLGDAGTKGNAARPVVETIDRSNLVEVQTPQLFKHELLRRAYEQGDLDGATDDATLVERLGETVHTVAGDRFNLKITSPADLALVRKIFHGGPPKDKPTHKRF